MGYPVYRVASVVESVRAVADAVRPSAVVVQAGAPVPLAEAFAGIGIPTILYFHDVEFHQLGGPLNQRPGLSFLANSRFTATKIAQAYGFRPPMLPPLVTPGLYRVQSERRSVVFVNPHPLKGVEIALALAKRRPDIPFEFVESWELAPESRRALLEEAARLGNVHWRQWGLDMKPVYLAAKLILAPSRWEEGWGRVVSEAQVSGIPALASRRGGLPEAVGPGGILIEPDAELSEWEQALATLWDDSSAYRTLADAAVAHARREDFQEDAVTSAFIDFVQGRGAPS
jgi:glycosyltransferase involved in cell wall biosynthesis